MAWKNYIPVALLVLALLLFLIGVIGYELSRRRDRATWYWWMFGLSFLLAFTAVLVALGMKLHHERSFMKGLPESLYHQSAECDRSDN